MKKLILLLLLSPLAAAQVPARFDLPAITTTSTPVPPGSLPNILAVTNATVSLCDYPATLSAGMCTNKITTYTNSSLSTPCPSTAQLTAPGSAACIPTTGLQGAFGFWYDAAAQTHITYTVKASWGTFGPYDIVQSGVVSGGVSPNPPIYSVQAYSSSSGLTSDPNITINTTTHELDLADGSYAISQNAAPVPTSLLGIVSNGSTDNTTAVNTAFNQASAGTKPSIIFPPGATTLLAGPVYVTALNHGTLQPPVIDLNGGTLEFTGEGNDIVAIQFSHAYTAGQVVIGAGYNQKMEAACTSGSGAPTWGTTPFVSVTTWGTCSLDNFGENSETWHPSEFVGYGRQVSDGTYLEFSMQTGTSGSSTPTWPAIGSTVTDGGTIWLNTGIPIPASGIWQCDQGVNGLLRISNGARFTIKNGTIKMDSLTSPCLINWSPQDFSRTAFNTALNLQNVTLAQTIPTDTSVRTLSTAFYINRAALLHTDNMNFYGNFGVKISLGDGAAQDYATDENDVNTFNNTYLWDLARQYPLTQRSTAYTTGQLLRGSNLVVQVQAPCTTGSSAPAWSNTPGAVITDGSCSLTTMNISAALFPEIAVNTPQGVAFNNTYIEVGPGFNLQSTQSNGNVELNGGWIGDGNPNFAIRAESSTFSIHNFFIYNFLTGTNSFGTGIYAHPGRSGSVFNNSLSNQITALDLGNSVQTFGNILSTSNASSIPVQVNGQFNTISSNSISTASATSISLNAINNSITFNRFITGTIDCTVQGNAILARSVDVNTTCATNTNNISGDSTSFFNRLSPGFQQNVQTGFTSYTPSLTQVNGLLYGWNTGANDNGMSGLVAGGQTTLSSQVSCAAEASLTQRDFGCWFGTSKKWFVNGSAENVVQDSADPAHVLGQLYYQSAAGRLTFDNGSAYNRIAYLSDISGGGSGITALTGDGTATGPGSAALTLATVNTNTGACGDATHICQVTLNGKGLATAAMPVAITANTVSSTLTSGTYPIATGANAVGDGHLSEAGGALSFSPGSGSTIFGSGTASNVDGWGELTLTSSATATYTFVNTYTSHPECEIEPQFDPGAGVYHWVTYTGVASFTIHFSTTISSGIVSYHCDERN